MQSSLQFAAETARKAGQLLLHYFTLEGIQVDFKPDHTTVTQADLASDQLICEAIRANFPGEAILSEESNPNLTHSEGPLWVVDPLDGTTNFSLGLHVWGVSLARLVDGIPEIGVLYFPITDEMYTAQRGRGAALNGKALSAQLPDKNTPTPFFSCCSRTIRRYEINIPYKIRVLGAASYTFAAVARGNAMLGLQLTPQLWDIASGWLIVEEAGGALEVLYGSHPFPLDTQIDYSSTVFPTLMGLTPDLLIKARELIVPRK